MTTDGHKEISGDPRATISLCLIVKNEERNLADCLRPVRHIFDEIVIVDTGSVDRTREIAQEFGARLVEFPWCDSFAAARNEGLHHARGAWIFWLDADDRVDDVNLQKLSRLFEQVSEPAGYCMTIISDSSSQHGGITHVRLFPRLPGIGWEFRIHEQIAGSLVRQQYPLRQTDVVIHHVGYRSPELFREKLQRNLRLLLLDVADHPRSVPVLFHLGMTYALLDQHADAVPLLQKAAELLHPQDQAGPFVYRYLVESQQSLGQTDRACESCLKGVLLFPNDALLLTWMNSLTFGNSNQPTAFAEMLALANDHHSAGRLPQAEWIYRQVLVTNPQQVDALQMLGMIAGQTGRFDLATENLQTVLKSHPDSAVAHNSLGMVFILKRMLPEAIACFRRAVKCQPDFAMAFSNLGNALRELRQWDEAIGALQESLRLDPNSSAARDNLRIAVEESEKVRSG